MTAGTTEGRNEVEQLRQLVEIQGQIVELAKQNEVTAKECEALREELARDVRRRTRHVAPQSRVRRFGRRLAGAVAALGAILLPPRFGN